MGTGLVVDGNSGLDTAWASSKCMADWVECRRRCRSRLIRARASEFFISFSGRDHLGSVGGIAWGAQPGIARADVRTLGKTVAGGLLVGFFGSLLAALIGNLLLRVDLKAAGFVIGSFLMGPCWTMGTVGGVMLGSLANRGK